MFETNGFRKRLKEYIPNLLEIEGFPDGDIDNIISISKPPYFTLCPNPFIAEVVKDWNDQKQSECSEPFFPKMAFTSDVSEGKNHPIYTAHSYHAKVPHKAIMRYILHYTKPGDIVFDGFAGTGMTGVAAQLCGDKHEVQDLGFQVTDQGEILNQHDVAFSSLGSRRAILFDISPAACLIAANYTLPRELDRIKMKAREIVKELEAEWGWMYETIHYEKDVEKKGKIVHVVWSDVFICPTCKDEIVFYHEAIDEEQKKVRKEITCPGCSLSWKKTELTRKWMNKWDNILNQEISIAKQVPVKICYQYNGKRFFRKPNSHDLELLDRVDRLKTTPWILKKLYDGFSINQPVKSHGLSYVHHFFHKRAYIIISSFLEKAQNDYELLWFATAISEGGSLLNRERPFGLPSKLPGTLYISSMVREINVLDFFKRKIEKRPVVTPPSIPQSTLISCQSSTTVPIEDESIDYIFLDPPFGANLMYSELNILWESWLKIFTNNEKEAIINKKQGKNVKDYGQLLFRCFKECYRILKPGRWMTIEFGNTQANVWNELQKMILKAGFAIKEVSMLDKKQGSFKVVTTDIAVKRDLVVSAYKPTKDEQNLTTKPDVSDEIYSNSVQNINEYLEEYLSKLPVKRHRNGKLQADPERSMSVIYKRMVAMYVKNGQLVPMSMTEFSEYLKKNYRVINRMVFRPSDQV